MRLAVELYDTRLGTLEGGPLDFDFTASSEGLARFGANSTVLSATIPLTPLQRRDHAPRRRNWFAELLPEGAQYGYMLAKGGFKDGDTLPFLGRFGRDVAGALQLWDLDDPTEPKSPSLKTVSDSEIRQLLEDPLNSPLGNDPRGGRSSLGGVQPKVVLARIDSGWAQSLGGFPTTHILKPQLGGDHSTVIFDEEYGSRIARNVGLADFPTRIEHFDGLPTLVIERYDRAEGQRVHQEDFNQALGASRNQKYQRIGGVVRLQRMALLLSQHGTQDDLRRFAQMVILAVSLGNLDMHAKNVSLLHRWDGTMSLAPAYDVVPQVHHSGDGELALAVNGKYRHKEVTQEDMIAEFTEWGLRQTETVVGDMLAAIDGAARGEEPLPGSYAVLQEQIIGFVGNLQGASQPAGSPASLSVWQATILQPLENPMRFARQFKGAGQPHLLLIHRGILKPLRPVFPVICFDERVSHQCSPTVIAKR